MKNYTHILYIVLIGLYSNNSFSQTAGNRLTVPIQDISGNTYSDSGVGGMNNPQISEIDWNRDGKQDLLVFDRAGNVVLTYLNTGNTNQTQYAFTPQYIAQFPTHLEGWVLLRDFNGDGIQDIFTHSTIQGVFGIDVYKGSWDSSTGYSFEKVQNFHNNVDALSFQSPNGLELEIYVTEKDIPAVVDVDGDGDLDILTFSQAGVKLEWYKNTSVEMGYGKDSLYYELTDECWGKFVENATSSTIELSSNGVHCADMNPRSIPPLEIRHAGSTTAAWDNDGDGDLELLIGDLESPYITFLNSSTSGNASPWLNEKDATFPSNSTSAHFASFLAAFILDTNNDNKKDIIITPNKEGNSLNTNMIWRYENISTSGTGQYEWQENDFLIGQTLDLGQNSKPTFLDYNNDGLIDLLVGTDGYFNNGNYDTRLVLFRNVGTVENPIFKVENEDWLGIGQLNLRFLAPTTGDLDGDGDKDILVGTSSGALIYIENQNNTYTVVSTSYQNIQGGTKCSPSLIDLNEDGKMDIVTGFAQGGLNYFENISTNNQPLFSSTPTNTALGGVNVSKFGVGSAAPQFFKEDGATSWSLAVGSYHNDIHIYNNINSNDNFTLTTEKYGNIVQGQATTLDVADIDHDGYYEMVVGNRRGGLAFYDTDFVSDKILNNNSINTPSAYSLFPNPTKDKVHWDIAPNEVILLNVYDMKGRKLLSQSKQNSISLKFLPNGCYAVQLVTRQGAAVQRVMKN